MLPVSITNRTRIAAACFALVMTLCGAVAGGNAAAAEAAYLKPVSGAIVMRFMARYPDAVAGKTRTHHGIDIAAAAGARVKAAADGKVTFAGKTPAGSCVSILHKNGIKTTYLPLESINVSRGDTVAQGHTIGTAAAGGDSSCSVSHVHMGAIFAGEYIDPEALFSGEYKADLSKLIRRGNIPPSGGASVMTGASRLSAWPVFSVILRFLKGGSNLITKFWTFLGKTGSRFLKKSLRGFAGGIDAWRLPPFARTVLSGFRRPFISGTRQVFVFDPSGDRDEPDNCLYISLAKDQAVRLVDIYDNEANLVRRLEGWSQPAGGIYWSGDDNDGRIVKPGLYSVMIRSADGETRVILAEVRWHI